MTLVVYGLVIVAQVAGACFMAVNGHPCLAALLVCGVIYYGATTEVKARK